jgi:para-nitrobenzyl esterase
MRSIVDTASGRLEGRFEGEVHTFRAVPYAAPLIGPRRFQPPEPVAPWAGVRDATRAGEVAPQFAMPVFSFINAAAGRVGDDCLTLNVFTPGLNSRPRPVLVWIHGGGFLVGSGSTPVYSGDELARRGDAVVVTINYRLGAMGFAHLGLLAGDTLPGATNLGLRDQIAALRWVRENIERFGGDPDNVTIFGQSAGGMSVGSLLGAPEARSLFHRAICQSGACDHVLDRERAEQVAEVFLAALGGPALTPESLGRIPIEEVLRAQNTVMADHADLRSLMVFLPAVDGDLIPEQPIDAIRGGAAADIPIMTGATLEEWKLFGLLDGGIGGFSESALEERFLEVLPDYDKAPRAKRAIAQFTDALGDRTAADRPHWIWHAFQSARVFHQPSIRLAEAAQQGGGRAWSYLVTWRAASMRRALGSCHAIDIPFVFGSTRHPLARPLTGLSSDARRLSKVMQDAWIQFARTGEPANGKLPTWPGYRPDLRATMIFGRRSHLDEGPLEPERELLRSWQPARA